MRDRRVRRKNKNTNKDLLLVLIFGGIFVLSIVLYFVIDNMNSYKIVIDKKDNTKEYVYTVIKELNPFQEDYYDEVPRINIGGNDINSINDTIVNVYKMVSEKKDYDYGYKYNVSGNILSLLVTYSYYPDVDGANTPIRYFDSYIINLSTGNVLDNDEILKKYRLSASDVNDYLEIKFRTFYGQLIKLGYFTDRECSYKCFLNNRGISDNYLNGTSFYIEDGALTAFKYYYKESSFEEEEYFSDESYQFLIKK